MNKQKLFQGDVAYLPVTKEQFEKFLGDKKFNGKKVSGTYCVAHGETGNHHNIVVDRPTENLVEIMETGNGLFALKIKGQAVVTHEKHIPAKTLTDGFYIVTQKTEYDPMQERLVRD